MLVGSHLEDRIGGISVADGSVIVPFRSVSFPTGSVYNLMVSPEQTIAIAPDANTKTFRLLWSDGTSIAVSTPQEGTVADAVGRERYVAVSLVRESSLELKLYEFSEEVGFIDHGVLATLEPAKWLWRVSPRAIVGGGLTGTGEIFIVIREFDGQAVRRIRLLEPDSAEAGEWLELYDARPLEDGDRLLISAEWGIEGAGPADRADYVLIFDLQENRLQRSYVVGATRPTRDCDKRVYLIIADSFATLNGRGDVCEIVSLPFPTGTSASGEHFGVVPSPRDPRGLRLDGLTFVPDLMLKETLLDVQIGKIGDTIWFSGLSDRLWFDGKILGRASFGLSGAYHSATGNWWLFDPRGEWVFMGRSPDCGEGCGLSSYILDRAPATGLAEPGSAVTARWVLAVDPASGFPCIVFVSPGQTVHAYPLIDRRGEFPYSPTQEWDYTGIFRNLSYRAPMTFLESDNCSQSVVPDLSPAFERNLAGTLQWMTDNDSRSGILFVILEQPGTDARRIIGLQISVPAVTIKDENGEAKLEPGKVKIILSLEGEEFALGQAAGRILVRRRYVAFPKACVSRSPVKWEDVFEISLEGAHYIGSMVMDEKIPDGSCLRAEIGKVLNFRSTIEQSGQGGERR